VATVLKDIHHIEMIILIVAVVAGCVVWYFRRRKRGKEDAECAVTQSVPGAVQAEQAGEGVREESGEKR